MSRHEELLVAFVIAVIAFGIAAVVTAVVA